MSLEFPVCKLWLSVTQGNQPEATSRRYTDALRERLLDFSFTSSLDEMSSAQISVGNRDRFWIDPSEDGGARIFTSGASLSFQYGYEDPDDIAEEPYRRRLSFLRKYQLVGITGVTADSLTMRAVSGQSKILARISKGQAFEGRRISDVVIEILRSVGYDEYHRVVQDTKFEVEHLVITGTETLLRTIFRLASPIGYVVYETVHPVDKQPVFHFHHPLFANEKKATTQRNVTLINGVSGFSNSSETAKYGDKVSRRVRASGVIHYLPPETSLDGKQENIQSRVKEFHFSYEPESIPENLGLATIDLTTGESSTGGLVDTTDKNTENLANRTPFQSQDTPGLLERIKGLFSSGSAAVEDLPEDSINVVIGSATTSQIAFVAGGRPKEEATQDASATLEKAQMQVVRGRLTLIGMPEIEAGQVWTFTGFGIFDTDYLVTRATHTWGSGGYETVIEATTDGVDVVLGTEVPVEQRSSPEVSVTFGIDVHDDTRSITVHEKASDD